MSGQDPSLYTTSRRDKTFKNLRAGELSVVGAISQCPVILGEDATAVNGTATAVGCGATATANSLALGTNANAAGQYIAIGGNVTFSANTTGAQTHELLVRLNNSANLYAISMRLTNQLA